jgi:AmpD protein
MMQSGSESIAVDTAIGLLAGARQLPSPNCDARPPGTIIELLVIHNISLPPGEFGGDAIERFFTNRLDFTAHPYFAGIHALQVAAHLLIKRDGEIVQFVPLHRRAWHAGVSRFAGRANCNDFSIGIELEGADDIAYANEQYVRLAAVVAALMAAYPGITAERLVGHRDIAPERKTDPGPAFDWGRFRCILDYELTNA